LSHSAATDANRAAVTCAFAFRKASRVWRTSAFSLCIAASGPGFAGKRIGFRDTDRSTSQPHSWHHNRTVRRCRMIRSRWVSMVISTLFRQPIAAIRLLDQRRNRARLLAKLVRFLNPVERTQSCLSGDLKVLKT